MRGMRVRACVCYMCRINGWGTGRDEGELVSTTKGPSGIRTARSAQRGVQCTVHRTISMGGIDWQCDIMLTSSRADSRTSSVVVRQAGAVGPFPGCSGSVGGVAGTAATTHLCHAVGGACRCQRQTQRSSKGPEERGVCRAIDSFRVGVKCLVEKHLRKKGRREEGEVKRGGGERGGRKKEGKH